MSDPAQKPPIRFKLKRLFPFMNHKGSNWWRHLETKKAQKAGQPVSSLSRRKLPLAKLKLPSWLRKPLYILSWPLRNRWTRYLVILLFLAAVVGLLYLVRDLPSPTRLTSQDNFPVSTQIFDRNGKLLYEIYGKENRTPIDIDTLPPYVTQATISIEDRHFYSHFGVDITGIARATLNDLRGDTVAGGSTITQQLVKNALLTKDKTLVRKAKEAILAVLTEVLYSKHDILEMYMNYISYGGTAVGVEAASQQYFNKHAKDLDLAEASLLAGLPQAPSRYSPFASDATAAKNRQAEVLRRMREDGYITAQQEEAARNEVLTYALSRTDIAAPHFVFYVRDWLYQKYGEDKVEKGGLRVYTTLDLDLQNTAQASLSAEVNRLAGYRVSNGAAMVVKPNTGEILAMIGSRDYFDTKYDGQVNVTLALRQPGSSVKPLMYATAFMDKLLNPGSMLLDIPTCFNVAGQKPYCPRNYDGKFRGPVQIRTSLGNSLNIPAVKSLDMIGVSRFITQATKMGITTWKDPSLYGLSLTLGGGDVRMFDMAQAFSSLAEEGVKVPLTPILKIEDYQGHIIEQTNFNQRQADLDTLTANEDLTDSGELQRVMPRAPAYLVSHIMQDNHAREMEFGSNSKLVIKGQVVSAKTGTTNDLRDNWTVGFTPEFLTISWVGNNDGSPMNQALVSGITGAAPIWNDIMSFVLKGHEPLWQEKPDDVASAPVCPTGMPPQPGDSCAVSGGPELYWMAGLPTASTATTTNTWIQPTTGLPPPEGQTVDGLVLESHTFYSDPITPNYCADCSRPINPDGSIQYEQHIVNQNTSSSDTITKTVTTPGNENTTSAPAVPTPSPN